jgi:hypothetical protein
MSLVGAIAMALAGTAQAQNRVSASQKGSLLIFSKVEIKWSADGSQLLQDTFVDFSNDYPADVDIQAYFINGDLELEQKCSGEPCEDNIIQEFEPGWNTADCKFSLTGDQPHYWSAARGSDLCQAFTVLDTEGPGRPDPETGMATRILRGYVIMWAVKFVPGAPDDLGTFLPIRWNHLKGDAVIINYANGTAWEYNAWAFQANTGEHGNPIVGLSDGEIHLPLNGTVYDTPFDTLLLDFYGTGSTALSGGDQTVMTDTDLTVHAVSADLRQDGCGPVLTKIEAEIWNEFETKFSGTRRCICCWDQTMLSNWVRSVAIPNHFKRSALRTDKGKARLDGIASDECDRGADDGHDYVSGYELYCGPTAKSKRRNCETAASSEESEDAAILGLATKFLSFSPSGDQATAGMNLVGAGEESAEIWVDAQIGPDELNSIDRDGRTGVKTSGAKGVSTDRGATVRDVVEVPAD